MDIAVAIQGCKRNDRKAQRYLYDSYADAMLMLCIRYVENLADAEELMLNGFLKFFKHIDKFIFTDTKGLSAWLKRIMINECLMHLRKQGRLLLQPETYAEDIADTLAIEQQLHAADLYKQIIELPDGYRTVFNLHVIEGFTHKEIAELLGITEGTSKSQLSRAKNILQQAIKKNSFYE